MLNCLNKLNQNSIHNSKALTDRADQIATVAHTDEYHRQQKPRVRTIDQAQTETKIETTSNNLSRPVQNTSNNSEGPGDRSDQTTIIARADECYQQYLRAHTPDKAQAETKIATTSNN